MIRSRLAAAACALLAAPALADPPRPSTIERTVAVQRALAEARAALTAGQPRAAVDALEKVLPYIDGNPDVLAVLRQAYTDELKKLGVARQPDAGRVAELRERLALLTSNTVTAAAPPAVPPPAISEEPPPAPAAAAEPDPLKEAGELFKHAKFADAAKLFARSYAARSELTQGQLAAWAYCRVRLAADRWNQAKGDPAAAAATVAEIEDALRLAPNYAELQKVGRNVIAAVTGKPAPAAEPAKPANPFDGGTKAAAPGEWFAVESESVRVRFPGANREMAETVLKRAEEQRAAIFARWSGPPGGAWQPKCEVVLHPSADEFAKATGQPPRATGHALVKLDAGRATDRRIDLRADDPTLLDDALPRELTHVVLADLFPAKAPPAWAAFGMAVLAASPTEVDRHLRTLRRCHQAGELLTVPALLALAAPPADKVTGFAAGSVALVDYLVRLKGEKSFTIFLRDAQRYGPEKALERQYGFASPRQHDDEWRRAALGSARGQQP